MGKKTMRQRIEEIQEQELNNILEQSYKARKQEGLSIAEEYQLVDIKGWDEYWNMPHLYFQPIKPIKPNKRDKRNKPVYSWRLIVSKISNAGKKPEN